MLVWQSPLCCVCSYDSLGRYSCTYIAATNSLGVTTNGHYNSVKGAATNGLDCSKFILHLDKSEYYCQDAPADRSVISTSLT